MWNSSNYEMKEMRHTHKKKKNREKNVNLANFYSWIQKKNRRVIFSKSERGGVGLDFFKRDENRDRTNR